MYGSTFVRNQASDYTERKKTEICRFQALPIDPRTKQVFRWYRPRFLNLYALPAFLVFFSALVQKFYEGTVQYSTKVHVRKYLRGYSTLTSVRVCTTIGPTLQDIREAIRLPLNSFFSVRSGHHIFSVATLVSLPVGPAHSESSWFYVNMQSDEVVWQVNIAFIWLELAAESGKSRR